MKIWKKRLAISDLNAMHSNTAPEHLGIEFTDIGDNTLTARMYVDSRVHQPAGLLHGGVSCVLAETVGSIAAIMATEEEYTVVGTDINASHLRGVQSGWVFATAKPLKLGRRLHFWEIEITNEDQQLICSSRLTVAVLKGSYLKNK